MRERWLVVWNCQAFGFANCIQTLARDVECEALDFWSFAKALEARRSVLGDLFEAAKGIERRHGATLGGHRFRFLGPDARPKHDTAVGLFVARVFEASFEAEENASTASSKAKLTAKVTEILHG